MTYFFLIIEENKSGNFSDLSFDLGGLLYCLKGFINELQGRSLATELTWTKIMIKRRCTQIIDRNGKQQINDNYKNTSMFNFGNQFIESSREACSLKNCYRKYFQ